jgi:putative ABC transport system permease protein
MSGIYRGMIVEALILVDGIDADLWVVQKNTRGPFAEISRVPANLEHRLLTVPGVISTRNFVSHTVQREHRGRPLRMAVTGLGWPEDRGAWLPLIAGRPLAQGHFEFIADRTLGLGLGETLHLGKDQYRVVGIADGMVSSSGDGLAFFSVRDAQAIQFDLSGETTRLERAARVARGASQDVGRAQPLLLERGGGPASGIPALGPPMVSAVLVKVAPGVDPRQVGAIIAAWPDVSVQSAEDERQLLVRGMIDKARRQLGLFRALLVIISTIIMALILYTLTLDKIHDIAMLKLMGARNRMIVGLILQQALLLGALGFLVASVGGEWLFPLFPRRVIITPEERWILAALVAGISVLASLLGIAKALRVEPNQVLS